MQFQQQNLQIHIAVYPNNIFFLFFFTLLEESKEKVDKKDFNERLNLVSQKIITFFTTIWT